MDRILKAYNAIIYKLKMIKTMKIFTIIILLFTVSCVGMGDFAYKVDFQQRLKDYTFDSDLALRKVKEDDMKFEDDKEVKIIKIETIKELPGSLARMSGELNGYAITHYVKFSTDEEFFVYEDILKGYAESKNSDVLVYIVANDVLRYNLYNDNETLKIVKRKGYKLFNAFLFSRVELDKTIKINSN